MSHCVPDSTTANAIRTVAEAGSYIASVCFKHGPPERIGIELEWLVHDPSDPLRRPDGSILLAALGEHAPRTLDPASPAVALPAGGLVSVEPGGQLEISSAPATSVSELISAMNRDVTALTALLAPTGFLLGDLAADPYRPPHRILSTARYEAMAAAFDAVGPAGRVMMCATAATQVCVDLGTAEVADRRWKVAHALGPVLLAAFANSARLAAGASLGPAEPEVDRQPVSNRMASWWRLDPERTLPPGSPEPGDYVERALDTQVLARCRPDGPWRVAEEMTLRQWVESGEPLDTADIDLHLSMLFPPVRPQGYLELRYLDAQPAGEWIAPLALIAALFADPATVDGALECCTEGADRWQQATEVGLADPILRRCAAELLALAEPAVAALELPPATQIEVERLLQRRLGAAISPAMDDLSNQPTTGGSGPGRPTSAPQLTTGGAR
ncbi:MAG: glutamate-cysteine ligase family protein [Actinomycetota bacterium]|nr:glutamate-cysteine ligase family protein [Actinomycetota bacterium]